MWSFHRNLYFSFKVVLTKVARVYSWNVCFMWKHFMSHFPERFSPKSSKYLGETTTVLLTLSFLLKNSVCQTNYRLNGSFFFNFSFVFCVYNYIDFITQSQYKNCLHPFEWVQIIFYQYVYQENHDKILTFLIDTLLICLDGPFNFNFFPFCIDFINRECNHFQKMNFWFRLFSSRINFLFTWLAICPITFV